MRRYAVAVIAAVVCGGLFALVALNPSGSESAKPEPSVAATFPPATVVATVSTPETDLPVTAAIERRAPAPDSPATSAKPRPPRTTTTLAPLSLTDRVLAAASGEVGKAGPYASRPETGGTFKSRGYTTSGFWCDDFVDWVAAAAQVPGWKAGNGPAEMKGLAERSGRASETPIVGVLIFVDLLGEGNPNDYVTHVGVVERVDGKSVFTIEGNAAPDTSVVTRHERKIGDGYVAGFAGW